MTKMFNFDDRVAVYDEGSEDEYDFSFCRIVYRDRLGNEELVWNSREGYAPFVIPSYYTEGDMHFIMDKTQVPEPDYTPIVGERVIVDIDDDMAPNMANMFVNTYWRCWFSKNVPDGMTDADFREILLAEKLEEYSNPKLSGYAIRVTQIWIDDLERIRNGKRNE